VDWLTFISSIVGSLAWPLLVLFFFCVLWRTSPKWAPYIGQLKYGDIELNFVQKAADVAVASVELLAPKAIVEATGTSGSTPAADPGAEVTATKLDPLIKKSSTTGVDDASEWINSVTYLEYQNLVQLAENSPATAITVAWRMVEKAVRQALHMKFGGVLKMPVLTKRLDESGHFTDQQISVFQELYRLRNAVMHEGNIEVTQPAAINYIQAAINLTNSLRAPHLGQTNQAAATAN
jgi:hypothetical protein